MIDAEAVKDVRRQNGLKRHQIKIPMLPVAPSLMEIFQWIKYWQYYTILRTIAETKNIPEEHWISQPQPIITMLYFFDFKV